MIGDKVGMISSFGHSSSFSETPTKCIEVVTRWGEPSHKSVDSNGSTFVYKEEGFAWAGIMPMIGIPIPLVIPVESKSTTLICKNDVVIMASKTVTGYSAAYCGMISEAPQWGCKTENSHF
jgi:hypothetical protein